MNESLTDADAIVLAVLLQTDCRYFACPSATCRGKKVQSADGGQFYCEKCGQTSAEPQLRYLLSLLIQDDSGSIWISCFDREAEVKQTQYKRL